MHRKRTIEIQKLAERIEAELASGRVDNADLSDEQAKQVVEVLRPALPVELPSMARRALRRTAVYAAASPMLPTLLASMACASVA
ncbi:hypothetical protein ACNAW0_00560 [Micromonospora sp. SL1-18]|uniref:hypothetical protein n=1 Tax=Micromonospora sp. SL1-18 TaxID=3399128 RepID=UPI003A4E50CE